MISPNEHSGINKSLLKQIKHKEKKNMKNYAVIMFKHVITRMKVEAYNILIKTNLHVKVIK